MRLAAAVASVAALAIGAVAVRADDPALALAGTGPVGLGLLLATAAALTAASVATSRPPLVVAAGVWCAALLTSPAAHGAVLFTTGLALGAAAPGAAALTLAPDRRAAAALAVTSFGLLGLVSALVFDPTAAGCSECPQNLLLVHGDARAFDALQRSGLWLGLAAIAGVLAGLGVWWRHAGPAARERQGPALVALAAYLLAVAAQYAHGLPRGYLSTDPTDRALWTAQACALLAVAAGVAWEPIRERRARARLARLIVELEANPEPRGLPDVLARVLRDPGLSLGYRLRDGRVVDVLGRPFAPRDGQVVSSLNGGGELLAHAPRVLDAHAIASAAQLPLRNERLRAELRARLGDLRAMRGRIVAAADAERRRLEHDLHDGAQQGLASLAVAVEAARVTRGEPSLALAHSELRAALGALREVAHGLVPPVLADEGLAEALEAYAETADVLVHLPDPLPPGRFAPAVEATAYHVVVEAVRRAAPGDATIRAAHDDRRLQLSITAAVPPAEALLDLDDRVRALGGELRVGHAGLALELPCGS